MIRRHLVVAALTATLSALPAGAQQAGAIPAAPATDNAALADAVRELSAQITELRATIAEMRAEAARDRQETQELRRRLEATSASHPQETEITTPTTAATGPQSSSSSTAGRLQRLEEQFDLLSGKVDDQYQTKVESGSKYRVRLSGLVLFNLFGNGGTVDSADVPFLGTPALNGDFRGSFGGTIRQSQLRFEVFGPEVGGAHTRADLDMDFAGGFPDTENGITLGIARIRTATLRFDWKNTSVIAGQDAPFFSPLSPTSLATVAEPAMSYTGNLWTWVPQIRAERRIATGESSHLSLAVGMLDPLSGELPPLEFDRLPQAGEGSRQPAFATRVGWDSGKSERAASFGIGGFYSRQNWRFGRRVDAWAGSADWSVPLVGPLSFSGEFYRGRALGGLGGGIGTSVLFFGPEGQPTSEVRALDSVGGWAQVKYQATSKLEFNFAAGEDNPFAEEFRAAALVNNVFNLNPTRNRSAMVNFIYRPRSNLLLSTEYRHIDTYRADSSSRSADHVNLAIGVMF